MASVTLEGVTKRFGDTVVLSDLSLSVDDGEFVVLLGPSGCGKSTVLRIIAGLDDANGGTVSIGGRDVRGLPPGDRDVAMLFQNYALYPHMTVRDNIAFPLQCRRVPRGDRARLVGDTAESLGLGNLLDRRPAQLSGGQRQRVALARALVRRPAVFLLDEPLSNLDAKLRGETREQLEHLHREQGTTTIYVTHDQVEAMTMADRIGIIDQGRVQQIGDPQHVYDDPDTTFSARFIGNPPMNCVPATLRTGGGRATVTCAGGTLVLGGDAVGGPGAAAPGAPERRVTLGVRPEHLVRSPEGNLEVTLLGIELLGADQLLLCRLSDGSPVVVRERSEEATPAPGSTITLLVPPSEAHLFDESTGRRLDLPARHDGTAAPGEAAP